MLSNPNLSWIQTINDQLSKLDLEIVYIGGTVIPFYLQELAKSHEYRATLDIDIIVQTLNSYVDLPGFEKLIFKHGFKNSTDPGDPRCRYVYHDEKSQERIKVDFLATTPEVFSLPSKWFTEATKNTRSILLPNGDNINIPQLPNLMILKLEG